MTPYRDPPGTLREAIANAIDGNLFFYNYDYESKNVFINLILAHVEDYLACEFSKLAYDTTNMEVLIKQFKKTVLGD